MPPDALMARTKAASLSALLAVAVLASPARATLESSNAPPLAAEAAASSARPPLSTSLEQARESMVRLQQLADAGSPEPLLEEQRNLTARLVVLLTAEQHRQQATARSTDASSKPVLRAAAPLGPPPYSMVSVDALRDEADAILAQRQSLQTSMLALEGQLSALLAARRKAEEVLRLREEQLSRAREPAAQERLRAEAAVARLEAQVAGLSLARADAQRSADRERLDRLATDGATLQADIERARKTQVLDDESISRVAQAAAAERKRLARLRVQLDGRLAARERTIATVARPAPAASRELAALRGHLELLSELDQIEAGREEVWRLRRLALSEAADPSARTETEAVLRRSIDQLAARWQATADQRSLRQAALRVQRLRIEATADPTEADAERRALAAMQEEMDALETVQERIAQLRRLLERSLDDTGATADSQPLAGRLWAVLRGLATTAWQYELFSVSETQQVDGRPVTVDYAVTVGKSIGVLGLFVLGWLLASSTSRVVIGLLVRRLKLSPQLGKVLHRWILSLLLLGVLIVVLKLARIPLTAFAFLGGALAIGIGFGTQNIIKNLISGVIILFERKVRVGDIVTIDGVSGTVSSVDLRATTVRGFDGIEAIVPNSHLLENRVSNWSYGSPTVRRSIVVGLRYGSDMRRASEIVLACAKAHAAVLVSPVPEVLFEDFSPDAQTLRLHYWLRLGGPRTGPALDSDLRHAIGEALGEAGLVIAFPQRDVHLDTRRPIQVELRGGSP